MTTQPIIEELAMTNSAPLRISDLSRLQRYALDCASRIIGRHIVDDTGVIRADVAEKLRQLAIDAATEDPVTVC